MLVVVCLCVCFRLYEYRAHATKVRAQINAARASVQSVPMHHRIVGSATTELVIAPMLCVCACLYCACLYCACLYCACLYCACLYCACRAVRVCARAYIPICMSSHYYDMQIVISFSHTI